MLLKLAVVCIGASASMCAQEFGATCSWAPSDTTIRSEGLTEAIGDIVLDCIGKPNIQIASTVSVQLNSIVTNIQDPYGNVDIPLTMDGRLLSPGARLNNAGSRSAVINYDAVFFNFPANGRAQVRISGIRIDGNGVAGPGQSALAGDGSVTASVSYWNRALNDTVVVARRRTGLLANVRQVVLPPGSTSPLPATLTWAAFTGSATYFASTRVSEGFGSAFIPRQIGEDAGTRILLRFSGYPAGARLFTPGRIAGSTTAVPTSAGDFGGVVSAGSYVPNSRTLLLSRVLSHDDSGAGGALPEFEFGTMVEVPLIHGSGLAAFEILDADPIKIESAQIPVFLVLPKVAVSSNPVTVGASAVTLGPVITVPPGPVVILLPGMPRFRNIPAPKDCTAFNDCNGYAAHLVAPPTNTMIRVPESSQSEITLPIGNDGRNQLMPFRATVEYRTGSGWLQLNPESDTRARPITVSVSGNASREMPPGVYQATVVIDAGPAGIARYEITLEVFAVQPTPKVIQVLHGASFATGPVAPAAFYTIKGENLSGSTVSVTLDGKPARITYNSSAQINFLTPSELHANSVQLVVSVTDFPVRPSWLRFKARCQVYSTPAF